MKVNVSSSPRFSGNRLLLSLFLLSLAAGLTVWGVLVFFDLGPKPPAATTRAAAEVLPGVWSQVGRTPENSGFTPERSLVPRKIDWSYDTSEPLLAAPAVDEERLYLTTQTGHIIALDRGTGKVVWRYDTRHAAGFPATATPAVAGDLVIAPVRPGLVVGLDRRTGEVVWEKDIGAPLMASPIVVAGSAYVGAGDQKLYALDAATGRERWTFEVLDRITAPVAYADDAVVVANEESLIHIVDTNTGRKRFVYDAGAGSLGRNVRGGPAIYGDLAYFHTQGGTIWAVDRRTIHLPVREGDIVLEDQFLPVGHHLRAPRPEGYRVDQEPGRHTDARPRRGSRHRLCGERGGPAVGPGRREWRGAMERRSGDRDQLRDHGGWRHPGLGRRGRQGPRLERPQRGSTVGLRPSR